MNKFIKQQLEKCKTAVIPPYQDDTTQIIINKGAVKKSCEELALILNHGYKIEVEDYIVHPYPGFTLHDNWNAGKVPTDRSMTCEVIQDMGEKMVKIRAVGVNDKIPWEGWLPRKSIKIVEEL